MIYVSTITTPANTAQTSAIETDMILTKGLIYMIEVEFPAGCSGFTKVQILDGNYQLFPATPGEYMRGDNVTARYDDSYLKFTAPYKLKIITWNEDDTYPHTVQIRVGMASSEAFMARFMPSITWDKFAEALAQAQQQQEKQVNEAIQNLQETLPPQENPPQYT